MKQMDLKLRTKRFALDVIRFVEALPKDETCRVLGRQLLRSGTSVGANYRSAKRAKSNADSIHKMGTVEEEADESGYWLELLSESNKCPGKLTEPLLNEANELVAITVASINTARKSFNPKRGATNVERGKSITVGTNEILNRGRSAVSGSAFPAPSLNEHFQRHFDRVEGNLGA